MSWWHSFPWQAVGNAVAVLGVVILGLKLATMFGRNDQRGIDHERRLTALESQVDCVPKQIDAEVSAQTVARDSQDSLLRQNVARMSRELRGTRVVVGAIEARCTQEHGPLSKVVSVDDVEGEDELRLDPKG